MSTAEAHIDAKDLDAADPCTLLFYTVYINTGAWARVNINGVPVYRSPFVGPHSRSGPLNYAIRPGENVIEIELLKEGVKGADGFQDDAVFFELYRVLNPDAPQEEKLEREVILDVRHPKIFKDAEERYQHFPFYHRSTFELSDDLATPCFFDAPVEEFGCEGTPELQAAAKNLYDLVARGDHDGLLAEFAFSFQCEERTHRGHAWKRAATQKKQFIEELLEYEPEPTEPFDPAMLHFEPRLGGRFADVTRVDEKFVIDAVCKKDPTRRLHFDLLMVKEDGRWRLFA